MQPRKISPQSPKLFQETLIMHSSERCLVQKLFVTFLTNSSNSNIAETGFGKIFIFFILLHFQELGRYLLRSNLGVFNEQRKISSFAKYVFEIMSTF